MKSEKYFISFYFNFSIENLFQFSFFTFNLKKAFSFFYSHSIVAGGFELMS